MMRRLILLLIIAAMGCTPDTEYIDRIEYVDRIQYVELIKTETIYEEIVVYETIRITDTVYIDNIIYVYQELPTYIYDVRSVMVNANRDVHNKLESIGTYPLLSLPASNILANDEEVNYYDELNVLYDTPVHWSSCTDNIIYLYLEPGTHIEIFTIYNTRETSPDYAPAFQPLKFYVNTLDFTIGQIIIENNEHPWDIEVNKWDDDMNPSYKYKYIEELSGSYSGEDLYGYTYSDLSYDVGQVINIDGAMYEVMNKALVEN